MLVGLSERDARTFLRESKNRKSAKSIHIISLERENVVLKRRLEELESGKRKRLKPQLTMRFQDTRGLMEAMAEKLTEKRNELIS